ncbi:MAG: SAM-dependent methyltransferase, partial [Firmicutes bacterium HGW-Firmicutes-17]
AVLINTGFKKVLVEQEIGELVWNKEEQVNYGSTPMFMIFAEK